MVCLLSGIKEIFGFINSMNYCFLLATRAESQLQLLHYGMNKKADTQLLWQQGFGPARKQ